MKTKHILTAIISVAAFTIYSCGSDTEKGTKSSEPPKSMIEETTSASDKGIGEYDNVELTNPLDQGMIATGQNVYDVKCGSCHKLTDEKLVGPGWAGVTERRTPEWIMNFVTNVEEMLDKDPEAQAMLEICMVRMPNQNLSHDEARGVLEFMRQIDQK